MTRHYLLDSNALGHFVNHRRGVDVRAREVVRRGGRLGTCPPVLGEFFYGVRYSQSWEVNLPRAVAGVRKLRVWPYDKRAAERYGEIAADLRRRGRLIQVVDMQLAAVAQIVGDCTVVSDDTDLLAIPGLRVENWED